MKLWLISQKENRGYDTYDSAVVAAETEQAARETHPGDYYVWFDYGWRYPSKDGSIPQEPCYYGGSWANSPNYVTAEEIGEASEGTEAGSICASFNAG